MYLSPQKELCLDIDRYLISKGEKPLTFSIEEIAQIDAKRAEMRQSRGAKQ